jgi:hypothetical protein
MKLSNSSVTSSSYVASSNVQEVHWEKNFSSPLTIIKPKQFHSLAASKEIEELGNKLATFNCVDGVRAILPMASNDHWVEFELQVSRNQNNHLELPYEIWDEIRDLVIDYEWNLRGKSGEKWYFEVDCVEYFSKVSSESKEIFNSCSAFEEQVQKASLRSSNANFVVL